MKKKWVEKYLYGFRLIVFKNIVLDFKVYNIFMRNIFVKGSLLIIIKLIV